MNLYLKDIDTLMVTVNSSTTSLLTIIDDIDNLTAIISNIDTMNTNIGDLQGLVNTINTTINTINTAITNINSNTTNLQAIISDINDLTAIISNIGTMNTNIGNLQAIISDIANIETQLIAVKTDVANINTNIGSISTAITNIEGHQVDIDTNINSVETLTTNIINQENKGVKSSNNEITHNGVLTGNFSSSEYLYNQLTVRIYTEDLYLESFDVEIRVRDSSGIDYQLMRTHVRNIELVVLRTYTFNPSHDINYYFKNTSGITIKLDYTFTYSELEQPNVVYFDSKIDAGTSKYWMFHKYNQLWNRMRILLYSSNTLNFTYKLRQVSNAGNLYDEVINETITTGNNYNKLHSFSEGNMWILTLDNTNGTEDVYFQILLFFSKNIYDLTEIPIRNHSDLQNVLTSQHHAKYLDSEAITAMGAKADNNPLNHDKYTLEVHNNDKHDPDFEAAFNKNSAFNKNFGTQINTVCQGNDSRLSNDAKFGIGIANKRWINLALSNVNPPGAMKSTVVWANVNSTDFTLTFDILLPYVIGTHNLVITRIKIGLYDADANDFVSSILGYGWVNYNTQSGDLIADYADKNYPSEFITDFADITIGGVYTRFCILVDCIVTTADEFELAYVQAEYYYTD